jgi:hypothetical protein
LFSVLAGVLAVATGFSELPDPHQPGPRTCRTWPMCCGRRATTRSCCAAAWAPGAAQQHSTDYMFGRTSRHYSSAPPALRERGLRLPSARHAVPRRAHILQGTSCPVRRRLLRPCDRHRRSPRLPRRADWRRGRRAWRARATPASASPSRDGSRPLQAPAPPHGRAGKQQSYCMMMVSYRRLRCRTSWS